MPRARRPPLLCAPSRTDAGWSLVPHASKTWMKSTEARTKAGSHLGWTYRRDQGRGATPAIGKVVVARRTVMARAVPALSADEVALVDDGSAWRRTSARRWRIPARPSRTSSLTWTASSLIRRASMEVQEKILARYGGVLVLLVLKAKMMGKKAGESVRIFVNECGLDSLPTP